MQLRIIAPLGNSIKIKLGTQKRYQSKRSKSKENKLKN